MPVRPEPTTPYDGGRDSIGGAAVLPRGRYPRCAHCEAKLIAILQFDVRETMGVPFAVGSHFTLMMCPEHDGPIFHETGHLGFLPPGSGDTWHLPEAFWNDKPSWHVHAQLNPPGIDEKVHRPEERIVAKSLRMTPFEERTEPFEDTGLSRGEQGLKIGGVPFWYQAARKFVCPCGAEMGFLLHLPPHFELEAPAGPARLFALGNATHVFGCTAACHPSALWLVHDS